MSGRLIVQAIGSTKPLPMRQCDWSFARFETMDKPNLTIARAVFLWRSMTRAVSFCDVASAVVRSNRRS